MNREATAYHEAGHAVASLALGIAVRGATIRPGDGYFGEVTHFRMRVQDWAYLSPAQEVKLHRELTVALAGEIAQRRVAPRSVRRHHGETDRALVLTVIGNLVSSERVAQALYRYAKAMAVELIEQRWRQVEAVAKELLERMELTGPEISSVMRQTARLINRPEERESKKDQTEQRPARC